MAPCNRYYAAACQIDLANPTDRDQIAPRVDRMLEMVDYAVEGYKPFFEVRLIVFPEFAHAAPIYQTADKLCERLAVAIPNEHTDRYQRKAQQIGVYIQTGTFLEIDDRWAGHVFNTTCLIGPDGILAKYRKVHPWIPWEVHTSPHDLPDYTETLYPVVETEIGRLGAAICYDWLFPEAIRQLSLAGAEVLIRVSAYMDPWGTAEPTDWWTMVNRVRAMENMAYVVAANQGSSLANYPPFSWPGGSMIVDYDGRILSRAEAGPGERIVVGPIDLAALRAERERRQGHHMLSHLRNETYRSYAHPIYPGANSSTTKTPTPIPSIEANDRSIQQGRTALKAYQAARSAKDRRDSGD